MTHRYTIEFRRSAEKQLGKLEGQIRARILRTIVTLADDPRPPGVKALTGEIGLWRIRIGDYRVVYEINDTGLLILVVRIAHRSDVYRRR
ncbi:MAG TPA: type II toxin-antitoxin system RelE/ParE family toxin [Actinophytocola sp.]|nr:type II toxin-antitoxin system RelE/ParE family toxin [Actinophytocola sp.]